MIKHLLTQIDTCESTSELCKNINVLKTIHWTVRSLNETKTSTIESCFRDAGFPLDALLSSEVKDPDDDIPFNELVQRLRSSDPSVSHDDIEEFDDNLIVESIFDDDQTYFENLLEIPFRRNRLTMKPTVKVRLTQKVFRYLVQK